MERFSSCCDLRSGGLVVVLLLSSAGLAPNSNSAATIQAEYLKALAILEQKFDHCSGEGLFSTSKQPPVKGLITTRTWVVFAFAGGRGQLVKTNIPSDAEDFESDDLAKIKSSLKDGSRHITNYSKEYSFSLAKNATGYIVQAMEAGDKSGRRSVDQGPGHAIRAATMAHNRPISAYFGMKGFHLDRVTELGPGTRASLKIEYSIPKQLNAPKSVIQITSGWFVVSPADQWLIREYGIVRTYSSDQSQTTDVGHVEYQSESDGQLRPIKTDRRSYIGAFTVDPVATDPAVTPYLSEDFQFTEWRFGDRPERDFTLSAFGLPEFGQTVAQAAAARSFPWWTVAAAFGFAGLAFGLWRLARRERVLPGHDMG